MIEFANPNDIFPAVTKLTHEIPGLINDLTTIGKVSDSMVGCDNLGMVIETSDTSEVIQDNKEAVVEAYNLSDMLKEETRIFSLN